MGGLRTVRSAAVILGLALILALPAAIAADPPAVQPAHVALAARRAVSEASRGAERPGIDLVARLVVATFPPEKWARFTEIGVAESGGDPAKIGDMGTPWPSVGLFQVRLIHTKLLTRLTGSQNRALWVRWLQDPGNNAQAARAVYEAQGLAGWGSWTDGRAKLFRVPAKMALREVANQ